LPLFKPVESIQLDIGKEVAIILIAPSAFLAFHFQIGKKCSPVEKSLLVESPHRGGPKLLSRAREREVADC
jgi:predicted DNA-binding antitoxin AbrB/MazE fold protein